MNDLWTQLATQANLTFDRRQLAQLDRYLDLLFQANEKMNLTRITDRASAEIQHVGDALTVLPFLPTTPCTIIDVGSGGGVPGIPLAIARPDCTVILLESTKKKAVFLDETVKAIGVENAEVISDRAEAVGQGHLRESADVAIARAVGAMDFLVEWCLPLVKKGGKMLAMKGARITEELPTAQRAIHVLSGGQPIIHPITLPNTDHHVIVEIPKIGRTNPMYPRDPTLAKGKPIS